MQAQPASLLKGCLSFVSGLQSLGNSFWDYLPMLVGPNQSCYL